MVLYASIIFVVGYILGKRVQSKRPGNVGYYVNKLKELMKIVEEYRSVTRELAEEYNNLRNVPLYDRESDEFLAAIERGKRRALSLLEAKSC